MSIEVINEHLEREAKNPLYQESVLAKQEPHILRAWFLSCEQHKAGLYSALLNEQKETKRLKDGLEDILDRVSGKRGNKKWVKGHLENLAAGREYNQWS